MLALISFAPILLCCRNMKTFFSTLIFSLLVISAFAQKKDFLVGMNLDLIKSDNDGYFEKAQVGLEVNYFFSSKFTATAGVEVWTREGPGAVIGMRWYPVKDAYIRVRGLFGENDLSIGGGWAKPMTEILRFESMADFYFTGNFSIRAGFAFLIKHPE
jgi:hypothetical protein